VSSKKLVVVVRKNLDIIRQEELFQLSGEVSAITIKNAITNGEIIEQYPTDYPFPSCLINAENLHIVCSMGEGRLYIITAYRPLPEQWEIGFTKRKEGRS
jgi:hypothetical protein